MRLAALGATLAVAVTVAAAGARAQGRAFEVESVKRSSGGRSLLPTVKGTQLTATNVPVRPIIRMAFGQLVNGSLQLLQDDQIAGGPEWIGVDRFDIVARLPKGPRAPGDLQQMIRGLLADRFKLLTHTEPRDVPVYALVVANPGRLGASLTPMTADCNTQGDRAVACGFRSGPGKIAGRGPIRLLIAATALAQFVDRPLVDRTGLTANYEVQLQWTPTPDQIPDRLRANVTIEERIRAIGPDAPSLFTAVQEQLGLKLDTQTARLDVLVIDRVEHPREN